MSLKNQTALITGATSGIGYELAKLFAKDECDLVIVSRDSERLLQVSEEMIAFGSSKVKIISKDLSLPGIPQEIYEETRNEGIRIDYLVNDAGVGEHGLFAETDLEKELKIIQLNVISLVHLTKLYLKEMLLRKEGRILQLASVAAYQPTPLLAVYAATKAFVLSFTDALINELKDTGVTMTALIPGPTDTDFFNKANAQNTKAAQNDPYDPSFVASKGYEGFLKGDHHVVAGAETQAQVAMSTVMPNEAVSSMARSQMEEKK